jgi:hypothetical protein
LLLTERDADGQLRLGFAEVDNGGFGNTLFWSLAYCEILTLGRRYRDRADCNNRFVKLKNQRAGAA